MDETGFLAGSSFELGRVPAQDILRHRAVWGVAGAAVLWACRLEAVSPLSREQCGSQARASCVGSPPLCGSFSWFGGLGDSSLSLELTSEFENTFVKADAAAEPRIPEPEGFRSISSAARNKSPVTIWQFYRPYVTDGRRAENRCAGECSPAASLLLVSVSVLA